MLNIVKNYKQTVDIQKTEKKNTKIKTESIMKNNNSIKEEE
jgi:hypothetical protein